MGDRQRDIILLLFAVQLTAFVAVIPQLFPLLVVSGVLTVAVAVTETVRRIDGA